MLSESSPVTCVFVTGKGGVGRTTVCAALGLVAAAPRPAHDRRRGRRPAASPRPLRPTPAATGGRSSCRRPVGDSIDPQVALRDYLATQLPGPLVRSSPTRARSSTSTRPRRAPASRDARRDLGPRLHGRIHAPHLRPRDRRRAGHRARPRDAPHPAHGRARSPASARCATAPSRIGALSPTAAAPAYAAVATPASCPSTRRSTSRSG